jgi:hypothetical protein
MTTDSYSFVQFIKAAKTCSPILDTAEIVACLTARDYVPLMLFLHRIAAYVAYDVRNSNEFRNLDDSDFIDAAQECTEDMQTIINAAPERFSGYAAVTFRRRIRRYLAGVNNGGMGGSQSPAERPISLVAPLYDDDAEDTGMTADPPIELGDPLDELIRAETVENALKSLDSPAKGTHGPKWDTMQRDKRVAKELGILQERLCPICHPTE